MDTQIYSIFEGLNSAQKQAVEHIKGPSLIVAGAGSGKTKVLTCRIANILNHGYKASEVLALTFTNKASKEMKERISAIVGHSKARALWMGTFHSVFVRFLREEAERIGFPSSFTIYDTTDTRSALKACIKELKLDEKSYKPNEVHSRISMAKNNLVTAQAYKMNNALVQNDAAARKPQIADIYALYEKRCRMAGAMDFDDLLLYMNILLRDFPEVLDKLQSRFSFILVDEYQDTNFAQYLIVKKLSALHKNICVVGDDAQSIYSFRGAKIENILNFKKDYPEAREFKLEQNYRSTQTIVKAANSLIAKNSMQLKKECFSAADGGDKIEVVKAYTEQEEAFLVAGSIASKVYDTKAAYNDFAVLYRTNAQSRSIEEALRKRGIPYKIFGGHSFYERAEVKDVMAYLRLIVNPKDNEAFKRVVNVPARGIGDTTVGKLIAAALAGEVSVWEIVVGCGGNLSLYGINSSATGKLMQFVELISQLSAKHSTVNAYDLAMEAVMRSGYMEFLKSDTSIEGLGRVENVEELFNSIKAYIEEAEAMKEDGIDEKSTSLSDFIENISLMSAVDVSEKEEDLNKVSLMTVHSSKGLEFTYVYIVGMEENLFPSTNSSSSQNEIEEERRLFYVAMTRAKRGLTLSYSQSRFRWGSHVNYPPSRFIREIDKSYLNKPIDMEGGVDGPAIPRSSGSSFGSRSSGSSFGSRSSASSFVPRSSVVSNGSAPSTPSIPSAPPRPRTTPFEPSPISQLRVGQRVEHDRFGFGELISIDGDPLNARAIVDFEGSGKKTLLLKFAKLRVV